MLSYRNFLAEIKKVISGRRDAKAEVCGRLKYGTAGGNRQYDFYKISSVAIQPADRIILIRAGIHGDEVAGPFTLMRHLSEIFNYAHKRGVKLVIFPLDNPSGYEAGTRYNGENDRGDAGSNDFVRYILEDGSMADDLGSSNEFKEWRWSSDPELKVHLPQETQVLHEELKKLPLAQIAAVIDIHGDNFIKAPYAYHYGYGDLSAYRPITEKIARIVPILKNVDVESSYLNGPDYQTEVVRNGQVVAKEQHNMSDDQGFIVRYDGSLPDLMHRLGARHAITIETTAGLAREQADAVNLAWIYGIIDLVAKV